MVLNNIPRNTTVVGVPGKVVVLDGVNIAGMDADADPVGEMLLCLQRKIGQLEKRIGEGSHDKGEKRGS
ncbi:MAG: hypothetical protein ACYC21_01560 [Eubacteriales bacterium]